MISLKLKHSNVEKYVQQVIDDPAYYMGEKEYDKYKDLIDFNSQFLYIETSIVYRNANGDIEAIPLKDGNYYLRCMAHAPEESGVYTEDKVLKLLKEVKNEYSRRGYSYYYEGHLL